MTVLGYFVTCGVCRTHFRGVRHPCPLSFQEGDSDAQSDVHVDAHMTACPLHVSFVCVSYCAIARL